MAGTTTNGFPYPESTDFVTDGAQAIEDLAVDVDAKMGLWFVKSVTVSNQSTLDLTECFTSDFDNYRVLFRGYHITTATFLRLRMLTGVNTPETGNVYDRFGFQWTTSASNQVSANEISLYLGDIGAVSTTRTTVSMDIFSPNVSGVDTNILPYAWGNVSGTTFFMTGRVETTTQYTGIRFFADAGNMTATASVYGYRD